MAGGGGLGLTRELISHPTDQKPATRVTVGTGQTQTCSYTLDICRTSSASSLATCDLVSQKPTSMTPTTIAIGPTAGANLPAHCGRWAFSANRRLRRDAYRRLQPRPRPWRRRPGRDHGPGSTTDIEAGRGAGAVRFADPRAQALFSAICAFRAARPRRLRHREPALPPERPQLGLRPEDIDQRADHLRPTPAPPARASSDRIPHTHRYPRHRPRAAARFAGSSTPHPTTGLPAPGSPSPDRPVPTKLPPPPPPPTNTPSIAPRPSQEAETRRMTSGGDSDSIIPASPESQSFASSVPGRCPERDGSLGRRKLAVRGWHQTA